MPLRASLPFSKALRKTHSYLRLRHSRSMKMLSIQRRVHPGDANSGVLQRRRQGEAGELASLIGIQDVGLAVAGDRLVKRGDAEVGIPRGR